MPLSADAQVVGTFRWQTQPYCNVLTLTIVQEGPSFLLTGSDDLCGAGTAPVTGTATVAGAGVSMGVAIAVPSGRVAHVTSTINLSNFSGTWIDADTNTGPFAFVNTGTGGTPRPAPATAAVITSTQLAPSIFGGTGSATTVARGDHDHDARYYTRAQSDAKTTLASFGRKSGDFNINTTPTEAGRLTDANGGGVIVAVTPIRLVLNGGVTVGNFASSGPSSSIECWFENSVNGGAFTLAGLKQGTESFGNTSHDQRAGISLSATLDLGAGSHNVRVMCQDIFRGTGSVPRVQTAAFSAVAISR